MANRLHGKIALITGAGSVVGMGYSIAALFLSEGSSVVITDIDGEGLKEVAGRLDAPDDALLAIEHDVSGEESWQAVVAATVAKFGRIDILVNNAVLALTRSLFETTLLKFTRLNAVNVQGVFLGCREVAPAMVKHGGGSIINMSSLAGFRGVAFNSVYAASKAGVALLTKSIALELGGMEIRCNSVHPGPIETGLLRSVIDLHPENGNAIINAIPLGRLGQPRQVANCVLFLPSDESSYVTCTELVVDGGLSAR